MSPQDKARPHANLVILQRLLQLGWGTHKLSRSGTFGLLFVLVWINVLDGKSFTSNENVKKGLSSKNRKFYERGIRLLPERRQKELDIMENI
ncbi:hypothetical protein CDAR_98811 [Caerostris darwini]|uniref:Uncharacterized protein n=1 Tax=Caerostris darwini TaxID=1538125 RepID=A0AAV4Q4A1_9ARAC|nr:hypothetical protein CDAR_98811 [Caerostris darwini]